jgi:hypothetical protein
VQDGIAPLESNKNGFEDIDAETAIDPANADTPTNIEAPAK